MLADNVSPEAAMGGVMRQVRSKSFVIVSALLCSGAAFAQSQSGESLGDLARENRAKMQAQEASGVTPKVITNRDLPAASTGIPDSSPLEPMTEVSGVTRQDRYADQRLSNRLQAEQRNSGEWKARIQDQEYRIAELEQRIDRVNAQMQRSVGTAQYDAPVNRYQAVQSERLAMMEQTLDQQKRRLAMMQDAARRAGMDQ
jgi:hypothetical protein